MIADLCTPSVRDTGIGVLGAASQVARQLSSRVIPIRVPQDGREPHFIHEDAQESKELSLAP